MAYRSIFNWSGGKDSALALYHAQRDPAYSIERLVTSVNDSFDRVSMHGVRSVLLEQQAKAIGLPLQQLRLPEQPTMEQYNHAMKHMMSMLHEEGFTHSVFGDIFLEDLRTYREERLLETGFQAHFPLWKRNTTELLHEFIDLGFKTILVCVKAGSLDAGFAGRIIDHDFIKDLPMDVDPCGENGEFHTFVFDGPVFANPIPFTIGEKIFREYKAPSGNKAGCSQDITTTSSQTGFWFCDLLPA